MGDRYGPVRAAGTMASVRKALGPDPFQERGWSGSSSHRFVDRSAWVQYGKQDRHHNQIGPNIDGGVHRLCRRIQRRSRMLEPATGARHGGLMIERPTVSCRQYTTDETEKYVQCVIVLPRPRPGARHDGGPKGIQRRSTSTKVQHSMEPPDVAAIHRGRPSVDPGGLGMAVHVEDIDHA